MKQTTIKSEFNFSGIALHSGANINVRVLPAPAGAGITFVRVDTPVRASIKASIMNVVATDYATTLGVDGVTVSTVEHLMAAFFGMGVDNATVELDGPEIPIMDGSAAHFVDMIERVGLRVLKSPKKYLVVTKPIEVIDGDRYIRLYPTDGMDLGIDYRMDFSHPFLTKQSFSSPFSKDIFRNEVVRARTFGYLKDVEKLRANGLAKGGCLSNAVVIGDDDILNEDGLRFPDEFVRHKVLDLMGDVALLGAPIVGRFVAYRSGHSLNFRLSNELLSSPDSWKFTEVFHSEKTDKSQDTHLPSYYGNLATI